MKNKILMMDCIEGMNDLEDESVDLVVTDPPYGIDFTSNSRVSSELNTTKGILNDGRDNIAFLERVAVLLYKKMKHDTHLYWFTRWDKLPEQIPMLQSCGFNVKNTIIWIKNNWSMGDLKGAYAGQYECIIFCHKGKRDLNTVHGKTRHSDTLNYDRVASGGLLHSHEKPVPLIDFLIKKSSSEGDLVLDPFMGSGTTAVACHESGRNFTGFELSEVNFKVAQKRISETMAQSSIFDFI